MADSQYPDVEVSTDNGQSWSPFPVSPKASIRLTVSDGTTHDDGRGHLYRRSRSGFSIWGFEVEKVGAVFVWSINDRDEQILCGTTITDPTNLLSGIISDHNHSIDCMD